MRVTLVVAMDRDRLIGAGRGLPWPHLPADMRHFRETTMGHPVIMGRLTWETLARRPLPGRRNVVLTRDPAYAAQGATVAASLDAALHVCAGYDEAMVIGGAQVYALALPRAQRIHLTEVHGVFTGDVWFPALEGGAWRESARVRRAADERNPFAMSFVTLARLAG